MNKLLIIPILSLILILIDLYVYEGLKTAIQNLPNQFQQVIKGSYWALTVISIVGLFIYHFGNPDKVVPLSKTFIMVLLFTNYLAKTLWLAILVLEDIGRLAYLGFLKAKDLVQGTDPDAMPGREIPRSEFLAKTGLAMAAVPVVGVSWGILSGAHDYRIRNRAIELPNLPSALEGIRIAQISDIHSGSFWSKAAVKRGVEMLIQQSADLIFFTGDLVNNRAIEMSEYVDIFNQVKAPLGVFSVFGNHDYGDYVAWPSVQAKRQNREDLKEVHRSLGWDLLLNENRLVEVEGEKMAVIGIENWSAKARFPKHGNLAKAYVGTGEASVKLLLSHDPSHWKASCR